MKQLLKEVKVNNLILVFLAIMKVSAGLSASFIVLSIILCLLASRKCFPFSSESKSFNNHFISEGK